CSYFREGEGVDDEELPEEESAAFRNVNFQKILICMSQSICCIYHSSGEQAPKTQCYCSGSVKHMHASCLLTWFKQKLKKTCELCHKSDQEKGQTIYAEVMNLMCSTFHCDDVFCALLPQVK
ncbi:unnamed protein product, partial [Pocillopora meandrina]